MWKKGHHHFLLWENSFSADVKDLFRAKGRKKTWPSKDREGETFIGGATKERIHAAAAGEIKREKEKPEGTFISPGAKRGRKKSESVK